MIRTALTIACCCLMLFCVRDPADAKEHPWRTELGYRFLINADELKDTCKHLSEKAGTGRDIHPLSINLYIRPYRPIGKDFYMGADIGPFVTIAGDARFFLVPVNITLERAFFDRSTVSPYVKAGISHHFSQGDFHSGSTPGIYAGIGLRLLNRKTLKMGMEIACDSARTELDDPVTDKHQTIYVGEWTFGIFADF